MAKFELKDPLSWFGGDKTLDKNQVATEIETDKNSLYPAEKKN